MQKSNFRILTFIFLVAAAFILNACNSGGSSNTPSGGVDPNDTAATVNGKPIKMEEVERAVKQEAQGQESRLSPLELAAARLEVLQGLIQNEVMYQKAEKEGTVPTEEEVTAEVNRRKTDSRLSAEEFQKQMTQAGVTEQSFRETVKKDLAIRKLLEKITGRIEPPKDSEIEAFFKGNPELFVKKRGVRLAAIVIDPRNSGEGDTTTNENEANLRIKEVMEKIQRGDDFATLAREYSEDPSRLRGGDLGYITEEELKQNFPQLAEGFMSSDFSIGRVTNAIPISGKAYIFKLQERVEKEENLTLDSPGVRQQITDLLVNNRKQILSQSYAAVAMNEAKIENFLAQKVVNNPNELSGARPAGAAPPPPANANANANAANTNTGANANSNANTEAKANTPAANK